MGNVGIDILAGYVQHNNSVLERLDVSECKFQGQGMFALMNSVKRNGYLKELKCDKNDISSRNTSYLTAAIGHGLTYLSLSNCNLRDEGGLSVSEGLSRSRHLRTVVLSRNNLSDESAKGFAEAITRSGIESLDLSSNRIHDAGGELLARALDGNRGMVWLSLRRNNLSEATGRVMAECVSRNRHLEYLNLDKNLVPICYLEQIRAVLLSNQLRSAQNKLPAYRSEVSQLKLEQTVGVKQMAREMSKCQENREHMMRDVRVKERLLEETRELERERMEEVMGEIRKIEDKVEKSENVYVDEETKIKELVATKEHKVHTLSAWIENTKTAILQHKEDSKTAVYNAKCSGGGSGEKGCEEEGVLAGSETVEGGVDEGGGGLRGAEGQVRGHAEGVSGTDGDGVVAEE